MSSCAVCKKKAVILQMYYVQFGYGGFQPTCETCYGWILESRKKVTEE